MIKKNIVIASDHAGYILKEEIKQYLSDFCRVKDLGTSNSTKSVDYPDYAQQLAHFMLTDKEYIGILICGSGIGISIAANRYQHLRAALCHNTETATLARKHNDANVIVLGARVTPESEVYKALDAFLSTKFEGGRHQIRVDKLS